MGICGRYKSDKLVKPIYNNHRRCTKCEVYYPLTLITCPCCKIITRSKPHAKANRERYINTEIRIQA